MVEPEDSEHPIVVLSGRQPCYLLFMLTAALPMTSSQSKADSSRTFVLADEWDPVFHAANASLLGTSCQWESQEPTSCQLCYQGSPGVSPSCALCFKTQHVYSHYLSLVFHAGRPACAQHHPPAAEAAGAAQAHRLWSCFRMIWMRCSCRSRK